MLKKSIVFFTLVLVCATTYAQNGITIFDSILSGGLQRKFRLYVPSSYNASTAAPLIFNLHGYGSNAAQQMAYSNFMPIADTAKFLIVHPDGTFSNGVQYWNAGFGGPVNDVQFISQLIDTIKASYNIDLNAVYSCGMSNGGIMSYYLACNLPNRITAIASVTGSMLNAWYSCTPSPTRPFPVMEIHGTADGTVPYNGNTTFRHIDSVIKKWRVFNNCIPSPVTFSVTDIVTSDNSTAVNYRYTGGTGGSSVELFKVTNGSHSWPGALPVISNTNQDFNASVEIWRFFRQYKLNHFIINAGLSSNTSQNDNLVIYPDPANEVVNIRFTDEVLPSSVEVVDLSGKTIRKLSFSNSIQVADLNPGIYFLKIKRPDSEVNRKFVKN